MRNIAHLAVAMVISGLALPAQQHPLLEQVHKVYLFNMTSGYDQYLANQLTGKGVLEVVTDVKLADAVFTEAIGTAFEARLDEVLPATTDKEPGAVDPADNTPVVPPNSLPRTSSFAHGRGNLFLVELKSRAVVWSTYRLPKNRTPQELDKTSRRVVDDLARDLKKK